MHEKEQEDQKRHKGNEKKDPAPFAVNVGMDHVGPDVDTQFADRNDADGISQNSKGYYCQTEHSAFPRRSQD